MAPYREIVIESGLTQKWRKIFVVATISYVIKIYCFYLGIKKNSM